MSTNSQKVNKPFLIGVAGGTASGKSTVCDKIMAKLGQDCQRRVALIKQDSFYRELNDDELALAKLGRYNFDHPDAIDEQAMYKALKDILDGIPVKLPIHDYHDNKPKVGEFNEIQSADVVLFEGVLIFYFPKVRDMFNMKLFVDTDSDTRLSRRVTRDVRDRGRPLEIVLDQYDQFVKPAFEEFCQPTKKYADMIIPRGAENEVAIGLINHNVTYLLSSEIPALRNGHTRPMHLRASAACPTSKPNRQQQHRSPINSINDDIVDDNDDNKPKQDHIEVLPAVLATNNSFVPISQSTSTIRSRSNSYVSSAVTLAAAQRISARIKEELDATTIRH